ncbi:AAA family ATPase [Embleya sp. NPDC005575]|uniref:AAA family ATPase n=1 Tax=Embleya sp. NPDC005575 TaxID=3156892 RepID=UPI0033BECA79
MAINDAARFLNVSEGAVLAELVDGAIDHGHRILSKEGYPLLPIDHDVLLKLWKRDGITAAETKQRRVKGDTRDKVKEAELSALMPAEEDAHTGRRAWFVKGSSVNGHNVVPDWLTDGFVSLPASKLRSLPPGVTRDEVKEAIEEDYAHVSYNARDQRVTEYHLFLSRMREGDLVLAQTSGDIHLGIVTGPPGFVSSVDGQANLRRSVEWRTLDEPIDYVELPQEVSARLSTQLSIVDLTEFVDALAELIGVGSTPTTDVAPKGTREMTLPAVPEELAAELYLPHGWLQECVDLLRDRPQLVFYGPPGTGKTFIAQALAEHLAGAGVVKLVQFHPAYSYEDFFEGYRPRAGKDGQVGFELTAGPFRKLVDAARENPELPHVLIIDEINRANLAKVFGELYFLLEYRSRNIDLMYSSGDDKEFTLPKNVLIIGTMNTADRSIALVDAAMRRRFSFMALHPTQDPVDGVLDQWLAAHDYPPHAGLLLAELNRRIQDPDFAVGPSYFMRKAVHEDEGGLERTWRRNILPLLEEHHYGDGVDIEAEYGFAVVAEAAGLPAADVSPGGSDDV